MKKPFIKGGKALTLAAALLCGTAFLGSFNGLWGHGTGREPGKRGRCPGVYAAEWQDRLLPVRFREINRTLR